MSEYSEAEQWERAKGWLRRTGSGSSRASRSACGGLGGWRWYQERVEAQARDGLGALRGTDRRVHAQRQDPRHDAASMSSTANTRWTPYAALGTLIAARVQVEANELDKAAASLKSVMDNATDDELKLIARLRLARVQAAQGKYDDALATLKVDRRRRIRAALRRHARRRAARQGRSRRRAARIPRGARGAKTAARVDSSCSI